MKFHLKFLKPKINTKQNSVLLFQFLYNHDSDRLLHIFKKLLRHNNAKNHQQLRDHKQLPKNISQRSQIFPAFGFLGKDGFLHADNVTKYLTLMIVKMKVDFNPSTQKLEMNVVAKQSIVNAKNSKFEPNELIAALEEGGARVQYENGFALTPEDITDREFWSMEGSGNYLPYTFISVVFYPCSLPNQADCAPLTDIVQYDIGFSLIYLGYQLSNKENPTKTIFYYDYMKYSINPTIYQVGDFHMQKVRIFDEDKDFSEPKLKAEFLLLV